MSPVVLTTGHPDPLIRKRAKAAGLPLVEKTVSPDLLCAIEAARRGPAADRAGPQH